jgi:hypothetical protein
MAGIRLGGGALAYQAQEDVGIKGIEHLIRVGVNIRAKLLMGVLLQLQVDGGHPLVDMNEDTCPLNDIPGFDSLTAIEATVELGGRLERDLPVENIFNSENKRVLCIREISERLYERLNSEVASHD